MKFVPTFLEMTLHGPHVFENVNTITFISAGDRDLPVSNKVTLCRLLLTFERSLFTYFNTGVRNGYPNP